MYWFLTLFYTFFYLIYQVVNAPDLVGWYINCRLDILWCGINHLHFGPAWPPPSLADYDYKRPGNNKYSPTRDCTLVNAPDLRTTLNNCVVDIFCRGVAVHLDLYASGPVRADKKETKTAQQGIITSWPSLLPRWMLNSTNSSTGTEFEWNDIPYDLRVAIIICLIIGFFICGGLLGARWVVVK